MSGVGEVREFLDGVFSPTATFVLRRMVDVSGVSGTGVVADGVLFPDGKAVTRWRPGLVGVAQTCVWDSVQHVRRVHGHGGATRLEFVPQDVLLAMVRAVLEVELPDREYAAVVGCLGAVLAEHRQHEADMRG